MEPLTPFFPSHPLSKSALDPSLLPFSGETFLLCRAKLSHAYLYGYKGMFDNIMKKLRQVG
jgi:hypothetical protein